MDRGNCAPQAFLVEHYCPGATPATFRAMAERVRVAVDDMAASGAAVQFLHSTFVPEDESGLCVFSSSAQALVEEIYRRASVNFERILNVLEIETGAASTAPTAET